MIWKLYIYLYYFEFVLSFLFANDIETLHHLDFNKVREIDPTRVSPILEEAKYPTIDKSKASSKSNLT